MSIEVREYEENDLDAVNGILEEAFKAKRLNVNDDSFYELVSVSDGEVSGYLLLTKVLNPIRNKYYLLVDYVCVSSKYRGTGASYALVNYAIEFAKKLNISYLQFTCAPFRVSAHKLYERCGFKKIETDLYRKELL